MNASTTPPAPFVLPSPVAAFTSRLPAFPGSLLLATALNLGVARQLPRDVGDMLLNKRLRIHVRDAKLSFDFAWTGGSFAPRGRAESPDLTISANARDFLALARREQDPDTLFFSRRLSMQGDTELGLMVKNTLDALELPVFDPSALRLPPPREVLGWLQRRLKPR